MCLKFLRTIGGVNWIVRKCFEPYKRVELFRETVACKTFLKLPWHMSTVSEVNPGPDMSKRRLSQEHKCDWLPKPGPPVGIQYSIPVPWYASIYLTTFEERPLIVCPFQISFQKDLRYGFDEKWQDPMQPRPFNHFVYVVCSCFHLLLEGYLLGSQLPEWPDGRGRLHHIFCGSFWFWWY